jgi:hypothetical protein
MATVNDSSLHEPLVGKTNSDGSAVPDDAAIRRAAWQFEDAIIGKSAGNYPTGPELLEADHLRIRVLSWQKAYNWALVLLVFVSFFETPAWCDNQDTFSFDSNRCPGGPESDQDVEGYGLSGVLYLPPGITMTMEVVVILVIFVKLVLERRLQHSYFDKLTVEDGDLDAGEPVAYFSESQINIGFFLLAWEIVDITVFAVWRSHCRTAFVPRTGYLCLLPAVQMLMVCIKGVFREFLSVAVFFWGFIVFFAWIAKIVFASLHIEDENFGSFSDCLNTMFVASVCDGFLDVFLDSYTKHRAVGLVWFFYLGIVHVLLLSMMLDTLCAAYKQFSEKNNKHIVAKKVDGIFASFASLTCEPGSTPDYSRSLNQDTFCAFCTFLSASPGIPPIDDRTAHVIFRCVDEEKRGTIKITEFTKICSVLQYQFWFIEKYSFVKDSMPRLWNSKCWRWFLSQVEVPNSNFDQLMNYILLLNLVLVVVESNYTVASEPTWMSNLEFVFSWLYLGEVIVKLLVFSWREYWNDHANKFDFFTTFLLLFASLLQHSDPNIQKYANLLRLLRLLRVVKQLKRWEKVQKMVQITVQLVTKSLDILTLLLVVVFFFTSVSVQLFGGIIQKDLLEESGHAEEFENDWVFNCNDMFMACGLWIVMLLVEYEPTLANMYAIIQPSTSSWWSRHCWLLFPLFYMIGVSIVFELVKAFTIEVFMQLQQEVEKKKRRERDVLKQIVPKPTIFETISQTFIDEFSHAGVEVHSKQLGQVGKESMFHRELRKKCKREGVETVEESLDDSMSSASKRSSGSSSS